MIYQTNKNLNPKIQAWGCYYRALQGIAEDLTGHHLNTKQIESLYSLAQKMVRNWDGKQVQPMNSVCRVAHPGFVVRQAFERIGVRQSAAQIGANKSGGPGSQVIFWKSILESRDFTYHYQIQWFPVSGKDWKHAILANEKGQELFNPDPNIPLVGEPTIELWRII